MLKYLYKQKKGQLMPKSEMFKVTYIREDGVMSVSAIDSRDLFKFGLEYPIVLVESFK
jgi:hypothetical protein